MAGALQSGHGIVRPARSNFSQARAFRDAEKRDPGIVRPFQILTRSVDIGYERVLLRPLIAALACKVS